MELNERPGPLSVGNWHIDNQHRQIIRLVKALEASGHSEPAFGTKARLLLSNLMLLMTRHFRDEEAMLERNGCPWVEEHVASHVLFIERLSGILLMEANEALDQAGPFVRQWLDTHVAEEDMRCRPYLSPFPGAFRRPAGQPDVGDRRLA